MIVKTFGVLLGQYVQLCIKHDTLSLEWWKRHSGILHHNNIHFFAKCFSSLHLFSWQVCREIFLKYHSQAHIPDTALIARLLLIYFQWPLYVLNLVFSTRSPYQSTHLGIFLWKALDSESRPYQDDSCKSSMRIKSKSALRIKKDWLDSTDKINLSRGLSVKFGEVYGWIKY